MYVWGPKKKDVGTASRGQTRRTLACLSASTAAGGPGGRVGRGPVALGRDRTATGSEVCRERLQAGRLRWQ